MALAGNGTAVMAWKCSAGASSQQWTGYSDGTLRINGKCLDVTGPGGRRQGQDSGMHRAGQPEMGDRPGVRLELQNQHRRHLTRPLTHGETRVLHYLPTNLSAREIAGELYLSVNTVKTQQHLYQNSARAAVPRPSSRPAPSACSHHSSRRRR
jgi:DNA-binding CsgD family transcriptional regulator